jgi:hypothetical protein
MDRGQVVEQILFEDICRHQRFRRCGVEGVLLPLDHYLRKPFSVDQFCANLSSTMPTYHRWDALMWLAESLGHDAEHYAVTSDEYVPRKLLP